MIERTDNTIDALNSEIDLVVSQFDHPVWTRAQAIQIARQWSGEEAPASRQAEARIVWSEKSLMVRFVCNQSEPVIVCSQPQLTTKTIGLWDRDVCEVFIAPETDNPGHYFEFEAAPTGEWVDLAINLQSNVRETDQGFQSGMTTAAKIADDQLTIIIRIPWSGSIPKPQRGDVWRVNLFRCVGIGNGRYLAWQPTHSVEPNFHVPEVFGWLRFA
jgi:hypothetical protein